MKNEIKSTTIYSNFYDEQRYEQTKQYFAEMFEDEEITSERIEDEIAFEDEMLWSEFVNEYEDFFNLHRMVCIADIGRWNGRFQGYKVIESMRDFERCLDGLDHFEIREDNGRLFVDGYHHDGVNRYEFRELTQAGERYVDCCYNRPNTKTLMSNLFTRKANMLQSV